MDIGWYIHWSGFILVRLRKSGFYGFCRTQIFSDSPPNPSCFPPHFYQIFQKLTKVYQSLPKFYKCAKIFQSLPNFQTFYQICTLGSFVAIRIVEILRVFFRPNLYPQKVRVDIKITFGNSDLGSFLFRMVNQLCWCSTTCKILDLKGFQCIEEILCVVSQGHELSVILRKPCLCWSQIWGRRQY